MWAAPDAMADMMRDKLAHLQAGASCAWVPSPTAAVLHALHYHALCVRSIQDGMLLRRGGTTADVVDALLTLPLLERRLSAEEVAAELENNAQGILGYVSRWVGQGIGCSKVQDVHGVALMEDRATLRISSQHMANWLLHGVVSEAELVATMRRMAVLVDAQNAHDPEYKPMSPAYSGPEWKAALELVFGGRKAPNGYTEPALTKWRLARKALEASK
jgi:malate synthase